MVARDNAGSMDENPDPAYQADMQILKVRKPYTITKQRERWTEEDHAKFLEALRLYGRTWRRIEEHIGTKSAVQIRSHAQKFFSKVARDSSGAAGGGGGDRDVIEIPPPRPKRRPTHPYPRKSNGAAPPSGKAPPVPNSKPPPASNGSPTSVLSLAGMDTAPRGCCLPPCASTSSLSAAADACHDELDNCGGGPSSSSSVDEENGRDDVGNDDEDQVPCLKLFGMTLIMNDTQKPCSTPSIGSTAGSCQLAPVAEEVDIQQYCHPASRSPPPTTTSAAACHFIPPQLFYCLPINGGDLSSGAMPAAPYWGYFYENHPFSFVHPESVALGVQMPAEKVATYMPAAADTEDTATFLSLSGCGGGGGGRKGATSFSGLIPSVGSAFTCVKRETSRGFVPYNNSRRCLASVQRSERVEDNGGDQNDRSIVLVVGSPSLPLCQN